MADELKKEDALDPIQDELPAGKARDLTQSVHAPDDEDPVDDPVFSRTRRLVMRLGTVFFAVAAFGIFIPMLVGVAQGIKNKKIWDPYTERPVQMEGDRIRCIEEAQRLLVDAGRHRTLKRTWAEPYRDWVTNCRTDHQALYDVLTRTRLQLRKRTLFVPKPKK